MNIIIHRGTHEIGGSCVEIQSEKARILLDIGLPLTAVGGNDYGANELEKLTGEQLVEKGWLPDIEGIYTWDRRDPTINAVVLSHPHLDHYGYIRYLKDQIPIYIGDDAKNLIQTASVFTSFSKDALKNTVSVRHEKSFAIGDFYVTPYLMDHSAFDAYAFLVESGGKRVFYSGDFRSHGRKAKMFDWLVNHGPTSVDALLMEGTVLGSSRITAVTEDETRQAIEDRIKRTKGIVLANGSSQNIDRLVSFYKAAKHTKRLFVVDVYTAAIMECLKNRQSIPYPSRRWPVLKVLFTKKQCDRLEKLDRKEIMYKFKNYKITKDEITAHPERICLLVRPSIQVDLDRIDGMEGGALIYSMWEGYLEQPYTKAFKQYIENRGVTWHKIHTGGHATLEALKRMAARLSPKVLIPIHTAKPQEYEKHFRNVKPVKDRVPFQV
jgi:ribonuclease J